MQDEVLDLSTKINWSSDDEQKAAIKFFNAAFRAEESGLRQAHELATEVAAWDATLADVLRLYGNEEGWHRQLLTEFLPYLGGDVEPMGRVTRTLHALYGRARRMETIVLTNLMFETIGSTTYRMALANVTHPAARQMLTILTRDEAFHVPLNVHFMVRVLEGKSAWARLRLSRAVPRRLPSITFQRASLRAGMRACWQLCSRTGQTSASTRRDSSCGRWAFEHRTWQPMT
jgi:hypothetical protein